MDTVEQAFVRHWGVHEYEVLYLTTPRVEKRWRAYDSDWDRYDHFCYGRYATVANFMLSAQAVSGLHTGVQQRDAAAVRGHLLLGITALESSLDALTKAFRTAVCGCQLGIDKTFSDYFRACGSTNPPDGLGEPLRSVAKKAIVAIGGKRKIDVDGRPFDWYLELSKQRNWLIHHCVAFLWWMSPFDCRLMKVAGDSVDDAVRALVSRQCPRSLLWDVPVDCLLRQWQEQTLGVLKVGYTGLTEFIRLAAE